MCGFEKMDKRLLTPPLVMAIVFLVPYAARAQYSGGRGTTGDPYQIATAADLIALGKTPEDYAGHFILTANIDLDPNLPGRRVFAGAVIALDTVDDGLAAYRERYQGPPFTGVFDGNGYTISHLTIEGGGFLGLFGELAPEALIYDLGLDAVSIQGTGYRVGSLAGTSFGSVTRCHSTGVVSGVSDVGGLVGRNSGAIASCYSACAASGVRSVGGLVGFNRETVTNCHSTGPTAGVFPVGGLIGDNTGNVSHCYSTGLVDTTVKVLGGFAGQNRDDGTFVECFWDIETSGLVQSGGGIGKTTEEMQTVQTFSEWDFETVWGICEGSDYPKLLWNAPSLLKISRKSIPVPEGKAATVSMALQRDPLVRTEVTVVWQSGDADITVSAGELLVFDSTNFAEPQAVVFSSTEDDDFLDGTAQFSITAQGPTCALGSMTTLLTAEEIDNEQPGIIVSGDIDTIAEGSARTLSVALPRHPGGSQVVSVSRLEGDPDITVTSGTQLVFNASNYAIPQRITLAAAEDADNLNGSAWFSITSPRYMTTELRVTELDNDALPGFVTTGDPLQIVEGSTGTFTLALPQDPLGTVHVTILIESGDSDITIESSPSLTFDSANYAEPQTVLIAAAEDADCAPGRANIRIEAPGFASKVITVMERDKDCGTGMPGNPYLIYTAAQMNAIGANPDRWDKHFKLIADIDLSHYKGTTFNIIGNRDGDNARPFAGAFDGNGHTITNFSYSSYRTNEITDIALFGYVAGERAVIKDLGLIDPNVNGSPGDGVGALVGYLDEGTVSACYVAGGRVTGNDQVGGLVGYNRGGTILHCYAQTDVSGISRVGGLVGQNNEDIRFCYSAGRVEGHGDTGGLVGKNRDDIADCFWDRDTSGQRHSAGGIGKTSAEMKTPNTFSPWFVCGGESVWTIDAGNDYPRLRWEDAPGQPLSAQRLSDFLTGVGTVEQPYIIYTSGDINRIGMSSCDRDKHFRLMADIDLAGLSWSTAIFPWFSKTFDGNGHVIRNLIIAGTGDCVGFFGRIQEEAEVYDLGIVDANISMQGSNVGILTGENRGSLTRCFSGGTVSGNRNVGGLVGANYNYSDNSWVRHCYSTAAVSGTERIGGLIGDSGGSVDRCYSTGAVSGEQAVGGLAGTRGNNYNVINSVWDMETSGQVQSGAGVGLTTIEMKTSMMLGLNGWALDPNWVLSDSNDYPRLAWEGTTGQVISEATIDWLDGKGTLEDPYRIVSPDQISLIGRASLLWDSHFALKQDIDLGGRTWTRALIPRFAGSFNGNGHVVSDLTITGEGDHLGLFGRIDPGAEVYDLGLVNVRVHGPGNNYGMLAGYNDGRLGNCYSTGSVRGGRRLGGLVGLNGGNVTHCYSTGTVSGIENSRDIGGLTGHNHGTLNYCYSTCVVSGNERVGGLVGLNSRTITQYYSTGAVTGVGFVGGLVGKNDRDVISCVWDIDASGQTASEGGIGLTTQQMKDPEMLGLNGWALDKNWVLDTGNDYPRLVGQGTPGEQIPEPTVGWLNGTGTENNPYIIASRDQLVKITRASALWDKHFELGVHIDLSGLTWSSAVFPTFSGTLNGNGFAIRNLSISGTDHLGFFGLLQQEAQVSSLDLVDVSITATEGDRGNGLFAGENRGTVIDCSSAGTITSGRDTPHTGGLVGRNFGTLSNCYSRGTVKAGEDTGSIGGLVGYNGGEVEECYSHCSVTGEWDVGGLVGYNRGRLARCYSTHTVSGNGSVGGLVGSNREDVANCYSTCRVNGEERIGGLVGYNRGSVMRCYSAGFVSGNEAIGGLVGSYNGSVVHSVWDMDTTGQVQSGGGVGLTTDQMMDPDMLGFNGWALDPNWVLDPGRDYPRLAWQGTLGQLIPDLVVDWLDGSGTLEDPYQVMSGEQLVLLGKASVLWDKYVVLVQDIDLVDITLANAVIPEFSGVFNGNGRIIRNMRIAGAGSYLGMFGRIHSEATVLDLGVSNVNIVTTGSAVGGLAGNNMGKITRCFSMVECSGENSVGGLLGSNSGAVINCYSSGSVSGNDHVGGLLGSSGGKLSRWYSTNAVSGGDRGVGGLVGSSDDRAFDCLWDIEASAQVQSASGIGLATSQMKDPEWYAFNGWARDPNWVLDPGNDYPRLIWEGTPGNPIPDSPLDWLTGLGTANAPYELTHVDQLVLVSRASILWDKHLVLAADIDLQGTTWGMPVIPEFSGTFAGHGHVIRHLSMTGERDNLGFFGVITSDAQVSDIGIIDSEVSGTGDYVGLLAGLNGGVVIQCTSSGTVTGERSYVGGLIGSNSGRVINCNNATAVSAQREVGGLVGLNSGYIAGSQNGGSVNGEDSVGGLVGTNGGNIVHCFNSAAVSGNNAVGGLVGSTGQGGGRRRGWWWGWPVAASTVMNCYSSGSVTGDSSVGGFLGFCVGSVMNCYATGDVSCRGEWDIYAGGFAGQNGGNLVNCYSTGSISALYRAGEDHGDQYIGGLVGRNVIPGGHGPDLFGFAVQSYWDMEVSGCRESAGGEGLTTAHMQDIQTFLHGGWDFAGSTKNGLHETWQMPAEGGYPVLNIFHGYEPPALPGRGISEDPLRVATARELAAVLHHDPYAHYQLTTDLDLSGMTWSAPVIPWFAGAFDGNGFEIRGFAISGGDNLGLFGTVRSTAEVFNLGMVDVNVSGGTHVGTLVGINDHGTVSHCYSTGIVRGDVSTGGLVGYTIGGDVIDSHSACEVTSNYNSGGLIGFVVDCNVISCYSSGSVSGKEFVGGLVGENQGMLIDCYSISPTAGGDDVGGLVGINYRSVSRCYSWSTVSGDNNVGGLVGENNSEIGNCYSRSDVSGDFRIGGLAGYSRGSILHCYSTGRVSGNREVGGLVGFNDKEIGDCFWDTETSGLDTSAGGDGLSTAAMQNFLVYLDAGWDFLGRAENGTDDIWTLSGQAYPQLSWERLE